MAKRFLKAVTVAGLLGAAGFTAACNERSTSDDVNTQEGVGGAGGAQDNASGLEIGNNPGVIRDGEGPLENPNTRPGNNPGVLNDGEGPIEGRSRPNGNADIGKRPGVLNDGEGPLENPNTRPGNNPGVLNDGEGPLEGNQNK